jgi:hypothetical protein
VVYVTQEELVKEELSESIMKEALVTLRLRVRVLPMIDFISVFRIVGVEEVAPPDPPELEPPLEDDPPPPPVLPPPPELVFMVYVAMVLGVLA